MKLRNYLLALLFLGLLFSTAGFAQVKTASKTGSVKGVVTNKKDKIPIAQARVIVINDTLRVTTDTDGKYEIDGLPLGYNSLYVEGDDFSGVITGSFLVTTSSPSVVDVELEERAVDVEEVVVSASLFVPTTESPVSLRRIGPEEIDLTPGANRDISKVVQASPGVLAVKTANRNDILVRGGGANENKYFIDGIEIPVLNHFAVQGGSGGNASLVNTDLLRSVNFYTGAFPAQFSNGLSSVMDMQMSSGNSDRFHGKLVLGASDVGASFDTPLSRSGKTTMTGSFRRSYLKMLFGVLGLPFLPTYNDYQFKITSRLSERDELYLIGLGSFDKNRLNTDEADMEESRKYILGYLPENDQSSYVFGLGYVRSFTGGQFRVTVSHDYLKNKLYKYENNDESLPRILDIDTREGNYRMRASVNLWDVGGFRFSAGIGGGTGHYQSDSFRRIYTGTPQAGLWAGSQGGFPANSQAYPGGVYFGANSPAYSGAYRGIASRPYPGANPWSDPGVYSGTPFGVNPRSDLRTAPRSGVQADGRPDLRGTRSGSQIDRSVSSLDVGRYELYATLSRYFFDEKLSVLVGIRADGMSYSDLTSNLLRQLSPRLSLSYRFSKAWSMSASVARYYQEPTYTMMGYAGDILPDFKQANGLRYLAVNHYVAGASYTPDPQSEFKLEGFYKQYSHLPVSLLDSLPVSTGDFADYIVGDIPALSVGKGRAYGAEFSYRNLNLASTVLNLSYTFFVSQVNKPDVYLNPTPSYYSSGWDVRHVLNLSAIHKFGRNWTAGAKWYLTGGLPYTPYDEELSSLISAWDARRRPYIDYARYNSVRLPIYHQLDVRVDKVWYFSKWRLGLYIDIQNLYNFKAAGQEILMPQTDKNGQYVPDPGRPGHYLMWHVPNDIGGTILPTLGITIEM